MISILLRHMHLDSKENKTLIYFSFTIDSIRKTNFSYKNFVNRKKRGFNKKNNWKLN